MTPRIQTPPGPSFLQAKTNDEASATGTAGAPAASRACRNANAPPALPGMSTIARPARTCGAINRAIASCAYAGTTTKASSTPSRAAPASVVASASAACPSPVTPRTAMPPARRTGSSASAKAGCSHSRTEKPRSARSPASPNPEWPAPKTAMGVLMI